MQLEANPDSDAVAVNFGPPRNPHAVMTPPGRCVAHIRLRGAAADKFTFNFLISPCSRVLTRHRRSLQPSLLDTACTTFIAPRCTPGGSLSARQDEQTCPSQTPALTVLLLLGSASRLPLPMRTILPAAPFALSPRIAAAH